MRFKIEALDEAAAKHILLNGLDRFIRSTFEIEVVDANEGLPSLMIVVNEVPPMPPKDEMVNVAPCISAGDNLPSRAFLLRLTQ